MSAALPAFTLFHLALSLAGILAGLLVVFYRARGFSRPSDFPVNQFTPLSTAGWTNMLRELLAH